jgi:hypothetical protein
MRRIIYRDIPLYSRRIRYPWAQGNVPAWWFKKRKPIRLPIVAYKHKRTKSAAFIQTVAPPVVVFTPYKRRKHPPTLAVYRHKVHRSAHFIPVVPVGASPHRRKPRFVPVPTYRHKRTKSAHFIPGVAPPPVTSIPHRRKPRFVAIYKPPHKRTKCAHFVPGVAPQPVTKKRILGFRPTEYLISDFVSSCRQVTEATRLPEVKPAAKKKGKPPLQAREIDRTVLDFLESVSAKAQPRVAPTRAFDIDARQERLDSLIFQAETLKTRLEVMLVRAQSVAQQPTVQPEQITQQQTSRDPRHPEDGEDDLLLLLGGPIL